MARVVSIRGNEREARVRAWLNEERAEDPGFHPGGDGSADEVADRWVADVQEATDAIRSELLASGIGFADGPVIALHWVVSAWAAWTGEDPIAALRAFREELGRSRWDRRFVTIDAGGGVRIVTETDDPGILTVGAVADLAVGEVASFAGARIIRVA